MLLLLLLSHFSRVRLCVTPWTAAHSAPPSLDSPGKNTGVGCYFLLQCMKVKSESEVAQLYPTLSDPMDCSPPVSSIHGIFQARILEWVAISFSRGSSQPGIEPSLPHCRQMLSRYALNQIPYDYTVEVTNRFNTVDLIDRMPEVVWLKNY